MSVPQAIYLGPGAGLARLHQLGHALEGGSDRHSSEYWRSFGNQFFTPDAIMHIVLWNPTTKERKGFEVPEPVIPRWFQTNFASGVCSMSLHMDAPQEYLGGSRLPPPPRSTNYNLAIPSQKVSHLVECTRTTWIMRFENGWQVHIKGHIRASFVPSAVLGSAVRQGDRNDLLLESFDFIAEDFQSLISTVSLPSVLREEEVPKDVVEKILLANGLSDRTAASIERDGQSDSATIVKLEVEDTEASDGLQPGSSDSFTIKTRSINIPESPINDYGITLRAMRCLEITESVCQLRELMDFTAGEAHKALLGPIEGLRTFVSKHKDYDRMASKEFVERRGQYEAAR